MPRRVVFGIAAAVLATAGLIGEAPGQENPQVDGAVQVTAAATPFRAYAQC